MTVADVHQRIVKDATARANAVVLTAALPQRYRGLVFEESRSEKLAIEVRPEYQMVPQEVLNYYHGVAQDALKRAFRENKKLVAGLVISEAHQGRNYLDRILF